MPVIHPRRSVLYLPGSNARALAKARTLPADGLILDLEDAVAPDAKVLARTMVAEAMGTGGYGRRELVVRVNGLGTDWGPDDLAAVARLGLDAVVLPKVDDVAIVERAASLLDRSGAPADLPLWCMIETPRGVLRAEAIADHPRVACLVMGTSDLTTDLHARHTVDRLPLLASLGHGLLAARAAGIAILDGVHLDLQDMAGFERACVQGMDLGFDGKTLIHPGQIEPANRLFAPSAEALDRAKRIVAAFEQATGEGRGVAVLDGRLVENLHVAEARRLLALGAAIAQEAD